MFFPVIPTLAYFGWETIAPILPTNSRDRLMQTQTLKRKGRRPELTAHRSLNRLNDELASLLQPARKN
jgi:hypothetical protein